MGESMVKAPDVQNKMGGSVTPHEALEVSVSFGRFENDSLSWEKWSAFSPNKYLEEVEKCSTPGSVAQKKAYFEAHYKKIAARKAELLEQENMMGNDTSRSNEMNGADHSTSSSGTDAEHGIVDGQSFAEEVEHDANSVSELSSSFVDEPAEADANGLECQNSLVESVAEEINEKLVPEGLNAKLQSEETIYPEHADIVTEETLKVPEGGQRTDEKPLKTRSETINVVEKKKEESKLNAQTTSQKVQQKKREQNSVQMTKKKQVLPATKSSEQATPRTLQRSKPALSSTPRSSKPVLSTTPRLSKPVSTSAPRLSKPISASTQNSSKLVSKATPRLSKLVSASAPKLSQPASSSTYRLPKPISTRGVGPVSQLSTGKPNISSAPRSKTSSVTEIKRAVPTSLHKSLDSGSLTTTKKSLIMEQMGDKDIVKRAFKSFQNNLNQLKASSIEKPFGRRPVSARGSEHKVPSAVTSQKENERTRKATEKMNAQGNRVGTKWATTSSRSLIEIGVTKSMKPTSSSAGLKREERAEKRKAFFRNLEEKSYAREEEKKRLSLKSEEMVRSFKMLLTKHGEVGKNNIAHRPE